MAAALDQAVEELRLGRPIDRAALAARFPQLTAALGALDRLGAAAPAAPPSLPLSFAGYEVLGELGRGGMGVVYKARQLGLNRLVALKVILAAEHAGPEERARFKGEAESAARLQHPNIVQVYEVGEQGGRPFYSLELVEGGGLNTKLSGKPLPPREAAALVESLARAMHYAHERGVVHRDLKPANVLLTEDGTPKITDFGLAKRLDADRGQTRTGDVLGTPAYMAPEQAAGRAREVGPGADVYALGAVLYECLTGRPPVRAATAVDALLIVLEREPDPPRAVNPHVPRDLETVCLKCLRKDPMQRYAGARDLADDLRRYLDDEPILARPPGPAERLARWSGRQPALATTLIALAVVYLFHLLFMYVLRVPGEGGAYHWQLTALALFWAASAAGFQRQTGVPGREAAATFAWASTDVVLFTLLLWLGHGPRSDLLPGYLVLLGGAALRSGAGLVWSVAAVIMAGYFLLALDAIWLRPEEAVEPKTAFIFLVSVALMAMVLHLLLRRVRPPGTSSGRTRSGA